MKKLIKVFFVLASVSITVGCNDTINESSYYAPISYGLPDIYAESSTMSIFDHWIERSFYMSENNQLVYEDIVYEIETTPLTTEEKNSLNIEFDSEINGLPCYKLLKNGVGSDILLFCQDDNDPHKRVIYAYSKSLNEYFIAYKINPYIYSNYCENVYIGGSTGDNLQILKDNIRWYPSLSFSFKFRDDYCFITIFYSEDMDVWCEAFGPIESKYGRLGIKDGVVPPDNLIRTDVIECRLGVAGDAYTEWYRNEYLPYGRQRLIDDYNKHMSEKSNNP